MPRHSPTASQLWLLALSAWFIPDAVRARGHVALLRARFLVLASLTVVVTAIVFSLLFLSTGAAEIQAIVPILAGGVSCVAFPFALRAGLPLPILARMFMLVVQLGLFASYCADGGLADPGVMWLAMTPLMAAFAGGARLAWFSAFSAWVLVLALFVMSRTGFPFPEGAFSMLVGGDLVVVINAIGCAGFVAMLASLYEGPMVRHFRHLSSRLAKANEDLRHELTEREAAQVVAERSRARAEAASAAKDALLANMSHEFRTPLTAILGFADVLESEVESEHRPYLGSITRGAHRLLSTLNGVLELAWLAGTDAPLDRNVTLLQAPVQAAVRALTPLASQRGLSLTVGDAAAVSVPTHSASLQRAVELLVDNAVRYTPTGGVSVRMSETDTCGVIEVVDSGMGMDAAFLEVATDPFRQASEGDARAYEGAGVGLSVASQLIQRMGGTLTLESALGHGTTARIELPLASDAEPGDLDTLNALGALSGDGAVADTEPVWVARRPEGRSQAPVTHSARDGVAER